MTRGSGITKRIMESAPNGAIFVWCNEHLGYPKDLAASIGRNDLKIVSPSYLKEFRWMGRKLTGIVVDHALFPRGEMFRSWQMAEEYAAGYAKPISSPAASKPQDAGKDE